MIEEKILEIKEIKTINIKLSEDKKINYEVNKSIDIRPFKDEDINYEVNKFLDDKLNNLLLLGLIKLTTKGVDGREIINKLRESNSIDDFQKTYSIIIEGMVKKSATSFKTEGLGNLDEDKTYQMLCWHTNIQMDFLEPNYALISNERKGTYTFAGDNLIKYRLIGPMFKALGTGIIMRDKYAAKELLDIYNFIDEYKYIRSMLMAITPGRAKNNDINTNLNVINILLRKQLKKGFSINEIVNDYYITITPSREFEPCAIDMVREELQKETQGFYNKGKFEDAISMYKGIVGFKGQEIIHFGKPLQGDFKTVQDVATAIDKEMIKNFHPFETHKFAYDFLAGKDLKGRVNPFKEIIKRLTNKETVRLYRFYATPYAQQIELD